MYLSHKTITVSEGMRSYIKSWPFIQKKIVNIYNGISNISYLSKEESREKISNIIPDLKRYKDVKWIGTIAELHPIKNIDLAISAMSDIKQYNKDIKYIVIGNGEKKEELNNKIKELDLTDTVFLTGPINEASKYLKAFDLFILVSKSEGLGYVLLEAGMAKLPTIATNVGGIPEIITDRENGVLIRPGDSKEISHAIEYIFTNQDKCEIYSEELYKKVSENFSIHSMISKTEELYIRK